jgi:hypothetical protein
MIIRWQGQEYCISEQAKQAIRQQLLHLVEEEYNKLDMPLQLALMAVARTLLHKEEKRVGLAARPTPGADPVLYLADMQVGAVLGLSDLLTVELAADDACNLTITNIQATNTGQARGQLAYPGDAGDGQDHVCEGTHQTLAGTVS